MQTNTITDQTKAKSALDFLSLGFKDYLDARVLLMDGLCLQLASTTIEKYLKAVMALRGSMTNKHLGTALLNSVRQYDPKLIQTINNSFIELLVKRYDARYFDTIKIGTNLAISSTNVLAEIDFTVAEFQKRFSFTLNGKLAQTPYDNAVSKKDDRLLRMNYILSGQDKKAFLEAHPPHCYEMRLTEVYGLMEVEYDALQGRLEEDFGKAAIVPNTPASA